MNINDLLKEKVVVVSATKLPRASTVRNTFPKTVVPTMQCFDGRFTHIVNQAKDSHSLDWTVMEIKQLVAVAVGAIIKEKPSLTGLVESKTISHISVSSNIIKFNIEFGANRRRAMFVIGFETERTYINVFLGESKIYHQRIGAAYRETTHYENLDVNDETVTGDTDETTIIAE